MRYRLRKACGVGSNLFAEPLDDIDKRRPGNQPCTDLEYRVDFFTDDEVRFVLGISAPARKLRDTKPNDLTRFQRQ